jgi:hypothetical protein
VCVKVQPIQTKTCIHTYSPFILYNLRVLCHFYPMNEFGFDVLITIITMLMTCVFLGRDPTVFMSVWMIFKILSCFTEVRHIKRVRWYMEIASSYLILYCVLRKLR